MKWILLFAETITHNFNLIYVGKCQMLSTNVQSSQFSLTLSVSLNHATLPPNFWLSYLGFLVAPPSIPERLVDDTLRVCSYPMIPFILQTKYPATDPPTNNWLTAATAPPLFPPPPPRRSRAWVTVLMTSPSSNWCLNSV